MGYHDLDPGIETGIVLLDIADEHTNGRVADLHRTNESNGVLVPRDVQSKESGNLPRDHGPRCSAIDVSTDAEMTISMSEPYPDTSDVAMIVWTFEVTKYRHGSSEETGSAAGVEFDVGLILGIVLGLIEHIVEVRASQDLLLVDEQHPFRSFH